MIITILENQEIEIESTKVLIHKWAIANHHKVVINQFASGEEYYKARMNLPELSDVILLDIHMKKLNGMEVAKKLRLEGYQGHIIFLTSFQEYVFQGYEVHALNYLLKPIKQEKLYCCLDEILKNIISKSYVFQSEKEMISIPFNKILCFTSNLHHINILSEVGVYEFYAPFNKLLGELPPEFMQVHRCHIVNMEHVQKVSGNIIMLSNKMTVQIARSYLREVGSAFSNYTRRLIN